MDVAPYQNRIDLLRETAQQITKDFGMQGMKITFSGDPENAYVELFSQVVPFIEKMQNEHFGNFYNLMYRIDISEDQIKQAVNAAADRSFSEIVADLILKRELQKVITRKRFSK